MEKKRGLAWPCLGFGFLAGLVNWPLPVWRLSACSCRPGRQADCYGLWSSPVRDRGSLDSSCAHHPQPQRRVVGDRWDACSVRHARAEEVVVPVPVRLERELELAGRTRGDGGTRGREQEQCIDCGRGLAVFNAVDWDGEGGARAGRWW